MKEIIEKVSTVTNELTKRINGKVDFNFKNQHIEIHLHSRGFNYSRKFHVEAFMDIPESIITDMLIKEYGKSILKSFINW